MYILCKVNIPVRSIYNTYLHTVLKYIGVYLEQKIIAIIFCYVVFIFG